MTGPPRNPRIRSVRRLGRFPTAGGADWGLVGQDGGQTVDLGDETLFLFADTLLAVGPEPEHGWTPGRLDRESGRFLGNCAALSDRSDIAEALSHLRYFKDDDGRPREILEPNPVERLVGRRFWPQHGLNIDERVWLYYLGIEQNGPGTWNFKTVGTGVATFDPRSGTAKRLTFGDDWRLWPEATEDAHIAVWTLRLGDHAYLFHTLRREPTFEAYLSRVPVARLGDPGAYEHLASPAPSWTRDPHSAAGLGPCGREVSVTFNDYLGLYLMIFVRSSDGVLELRVAREAWGPYSEPLPLGALHHRRRAEVLSLAVDHPMFRLDSGRTIFISYSQPYFSQNELVELKFV